LRLLNLADTDALDLVRFDAVILAGSLHLNRYQKVLTDFARANAVALSAKPLLFVAVSLSAAGDDADDWAGLRACHAALQDATGWVPGQTLDVAGAFRFAEMRCLPRFGHAADRGAKA